MSLLRQLLISVSMAVCVILAGTLWLTLDGARSYLNERLQADAGNAASSLALSLSQPANQDPITQELLMMALFDSGQFRSISFKSPEGEVLKLLERGGSAQAVRVPAWFDAWLPIKAPTAARAVSDGWRQIGEVAVTPEDAFARETLWRMTWRILLLVVGAGLLWAIFAIFLMRWLRHALQAEVAEQVRAIAEGTPLPQSSHPSVPRMKELASVQTVIQSVRERVRATAEEQNRQIETLQIELNSDDVTGVANRRYFINELRRGLQAGDTPGDTQVPSHGHVLIFRQRDLAAINAKHERQQADAWLRSVGDGVKAVVEAKRAAGKPAPQLARLNGSDFVVLLAGYDGPDSTELIQALRHVLDTLRIRTADDRLCRWSFALTDYAPGCDVGQVLARLDQGLMRAENAGHDEVEYMASSEQRAMGTSGSVGEMAWKALIQEGLREDRLRLTVTPARYRDDDTPQRQEALLAMRDANDGSDISGFLFMPPAVRLGLSAACDLRAIELGIEWLRHNPGTLVLRVSLASLQQPEFLPGLEQILASAQTSPDLLQRYVLEIDAHGFVAYPEELEAFCALAQKVGVGVGVRRLAEQPAALMRLHRVQTSYIKLGGDLIARLLESPGATQLIAAITEVAIGQGVKVYAHDIPNARTAALLLEYGVLLPEDEIFSTEDDDSEGDFVDD